MDEIFKALADPTRRVILEELAERTELTFFELCARLIMKHNISMSRQAFAKHLALLEEAGLVQSKRRGRYRMLVFNSDKVRALTDWTTSLTKESTT